jgi:CheY-like chemotaxis protein
MTRILIATADLSLASEMRDLLSSGGYHTAHVPDLDQLVTCCLEHRPDLVVADFDLPGGSLWTVTKALRSDDRTSKIVFFGLSSGTDIRENHHALASGFEAVDSKPVHPARFLQAIHASLPLSSPTENDEPGGSAAPAIETPPDKIPASDTMHPVSYLQSLSAEIMSLAEQIKPSVPELGTEGPELFGYIEKSGIQIREKLHNLAANGLDAAEMALRDREIRHDFRNMIGSVSGFSELLLMEPGLPADLPPLFTRIREYCRVFVDILDQEKAAAAA